MFGMKEPYFGDPATLRAVGEFMIHPDIYWAVSDRLAPQPQAMQYEAHLTHPDVSTFVATYENGIIGYVQFNRRTSIGSEIHVAFLPHFRGKIAKQLAMYAIASTFKDKGLLKLWAPIPADNRLAIFAARHIGFRQEGVITQAIVREGGVTDLVIYGITKGQFLAGKAGQANGKGV